MTNNDKVESLENRISELESQINKLQQIAEELQKKCNSTNLTATSN